MLAEFVRVGYAVAPQCGSDESLGSAFVRVGYGVTPQRGSDESRACPFVRAHHQWGSDQGGCLVEHDTQDLLDLVEVLLVADQRR